MSGLSSKVFINCVRLNREHKGKGVNKMKKILLSTTLLSSAIFLAACGAAMSDHSAHQGHQSNTAAAVNNANTTTDAARAFRVDYKAEPAEIKTGQPVTLNFTVKDNAGKTVRDLQIVHEKPMHLLIVSNDLAEFYHVHPEQHQADGSYRVSHTFQNGGNYKLYADFTPQNASQLVEQIDIKVEGQERPKTELLADENFSKTVGGLRVEMKADKELRAGQDIMLNFQAFDAASGKPATDLQNYLGELAHFVIISQDLKEFVHAHPMSNAGTTSHDSHGEQSGGHNHHQENTGAKTQTNSGASEIAAHIKFPKSGLYKIWAQFQRGGQVIDVPFIVKIS